MVSLPREFCSPSPSLGRGTGEGLNPEKPSCEHSAIEQDMPGNRCARTTNVLDILFLSFRLTQTLMLTQGNRFKLSRETRKEKPA